MSNEGGLQREPCATYTAVVGFIAKVRLVVPVKAWRLLECLPTNVAFVNLVAGFHWKIIYMFINNSTPTRNSNVVQFLFTYLPNVCFFVVFLLENNEIHHANIPMKFNPPKNRFKSSKTC